MKTVGLAVVLFFVFSIGLAFVTVVLLGDRYVLPPGTGLVLAAAAVGVSLLWTRKADGDDSAKTASPSVVRRRVELVEGDDGFKRCPVCQGEFRPELLTCPDCATGAGPIH